MDRFVLRLASLALAFLGSAAVYAQSTSPPRYYSVSDLGPGDAYRVRNIGLGVTAGALETPICPGSVPRAGFLYESRTGVRRAFCPVGSDVLSEVFDFKGDVTALGLTRDAAGNDRPALWTKQSDGSILPQLFRLPTGSSSGVAWGIDSVGQVAGEVTVSGERRAAYWLIPSFAPTVMPVSGTSAAFAITGSTTDPVTAGQHQGRFALWYPKRSTNAVVYPLGTEPSVAYRLFSSSGVLTTVGQVGAPGNARAFRWRSDTGLTELPAAGGDSAARDLQLSSGRIVGYAGGGGETRAVLWEGIQAWDLNEMMLPTCRDGHPDNCKPWHLDAAHSIGDEGVIVGSGTYGGVRHAFLAKPVEMLTWQDGLCAASFQPLCVPEPAKTSTELIIDHFRIKRKTSLSESAIEAYAASAQAHQQDDGISVPSAGAKFTSYVIFDYGSVVANLLPGQTQLDVRFHFQVQGTAFTVNSQTNGAANASIALRPARNIGEYSSASGSIQVVNGAANRYGFFSGVETGSESSTVLPLQIQPFTGSGLEVRIEGSVGASALASGSPTYGEGSASVVFCAEDPRSITLADGTPLAELGIKYTLWPTVRVDPEQKEDFPCRNPLEGLPAEGTVCPSGGPASILRVEAPPALQAGQTIELLVSASPAGGSLTATVPSRNATIERTGPCTTYPDGNARCPVRVRADATLPLESVVVVRVRYDHPQGCQAERNVTLPVSRLEIVDPISGDAPRLLDSATPLGSQPAQFIRRDPALLATMGARVRGLAADGVTPVILRFRAPGAGSVTFTLADDRGSRDPARAGRLADLLGQPATTANPVTVAARQVGSAWWAFAVLTAPIDFVRPGVAGDADLGQSKPRQLDLTAVFAPSGGGSSLTVTRKVDLVRPPVVLVHGVWSDGASWKWPLLRDGRFFVYPHDYEPHAGKSFLENQSQVWWGVNNAFQAFRKKGFAVTQADVFGHSMGGILSRIYAGGRIYAQLRGTPADVARAHEYREPANFYTGTLHKLVIIDSPQLGSPIANYVVARPALREAFILLSEPRAAGGAMEDLRRGGTAVQSLPPIGLPVHAFVGQGGRQWVQNQPPVFTHWAGILIQMMALSGAANFMDNLFLPEPDYDVIVGVCSQRAGLPAGAAVGPVTSDPFQAMHTSNTSSADYNRAAIDLLNKPVADPAFAAGLPIPSISPLSLCTPQTALLAEAPEAEPKLLLAEKTEPVIVEGGLVIATPSPEATVTAGSTLPVTVAGAAGFTPVRIFLRYGHGFTGVEAASFDDVVDVPTDAAGRIELVAVAEDAQGRIASASVPLRVDVPAALTGLAMSSQPLLLSATTPSASATVTGSFDDGVERDVSAAAAGTTYWSDDPTIATVDANGTVTAVKAGSTIVHAANSGLATIVEVRVSSTPGDADGDGAVGLSDFLELRACWTGPGSDPAFQTPPNACRDTFDADGDGDVDRADYDAFLLRYTGPANDCNANSQSDLTDIVEGVSADADGNGVPDEC
ncbi:MAG TPA: Ig-like domain-containing protein [Thermoanaerobaculia bacterium]